jgi:hypothetical protein
MTEPTTADAIVDEHTCLWRGDAGELLTARGASCCDWCVARTVRSARGAAVGGAAHR